MMMQWRKKSSFIVFLILLMVSTSFLYSEDFSAGMRLLSENRSSEAVDYFRTAIDDFPKEKNAYIYLAIAFEQQNDYIEAIGVLNLGLVRLGQDSDFYYNLGNCYFALGNWAQAISHYDFAINRNSDYSNAYLNRGNSNVKLYHYSAAINDYTIFLELAPNDPQREEVIRMIELLRKRPDGSPWGQGGSGTGGGGSGSGGSGGSGGGSGSGAGGSGGGAGSGLNLDDLLNSIADINKETDSLNINPDGSVEDNYDVEFDIE